MFCPQCGAQLGEGAKGCGACGWSSSRKTLWIVLGSIFGLLLLVCCGVGTWFFIKAKAVAEKFQARLTPELVFFSRVQVVNYAKKRGSLPPDLQAAWEEPLPELRDRDGDRIEVKVEAKDRARDVWGRDLRYTTEEDGAFEVRSAGPDGTFDNGDDLVEKGRADEDLDALLTELKARWERIGDELIRELGFDPEDLRDGGGKKEPAPAPAPAPGGK